MQIKIIKALSLILSVILLTVNISALEPNIDGGEGGLGQGSNDNGWAVASTSNGYIYDADGLRVYIVNSSTGRPVSSAIDITNYSIAKNNVRNFQGQTKFDYKHINESLNFSTFYDYTKPATPLPRIVSNNLAGNTSSTRVAAIKEWFTNFNSYSWVISQFGFSLSDMQANGYKLAIEPIAYFRYGGYNYAMTATEAALFDKLAGGALSSKLAPLTRQNLPLAVFLEHDEFVSSSYRINEWEGTRSSYVPNDDIIRQLGIGYISYAEGSGVTPQTGTANFSYPTDTWVVTPFRLCNVRWGNNSWVSDEAVTSRKPAEAQVIIDGLEYKITDIYIPRAVSRLYG
jgi:hypothetical protein